MPLQCGYIDPPHQLCPDIDYQTPYPHNKTITLDYDEKSKNNNEKRIQLCNKTFPRCKEEKADDEGTIQVEGNGNSTQMEHDFMPRDHSHQNDINTLMLPNNTEIEANTTKARLNDKPDINADTIAAAKTTSHAKIEPHIVEPVKCESPLELLVFNTTKSMDLLYYHTSSTDHCDPFIDLPSSSLNIKEAPSHITQFNSTNDIMLSNFTNLDAFGLINNCSTGCEPWHTSKKRLRSSRSAYSRLEFETCSASNAILEYQLLLTLTNRGNVTIETINPLIAATAPNTYRTLINDGTLQLRMSRGQTKIIVTAIDTDLERILLRNGTFAKDGACLTTAAGALLGPRSMGMPDIPAESGEEQTHTFFLLLICMTAVSLVIGLVIWSRNKWRDRNEGYESPNMSSTNALDNGNEMENFRIDSDTSSDHDL